MHSDHICALLSVDPERKAVMLGEKRELQRTGGRGDRTKGNAGVLGGCRGVGSSGQANVLLFALKTDTAGGGGCLGSTQTFLCWVMAPHSFILAVGAAAVLCNRLLGGWRRWRSTRMTLFWKYVPVEHSLSLGHPNPELSKPLGPALLVIALALSLITLLGKELARKRAKPALAVAPISKLEPKAGFFLLFFFLSFFFLSQAHFLG